MSDTTVGRGSVRVRSYKMQSAMVTRKSTESDSS